MNRNCLVVIPVSKPSYSLGFSSPLSWLFSSSIKNVQGVYSFLLTKKLIREHEYFIIELNWITEFYESLFLLESIKKINPSSKIMFGGLFGSLHYQYLIKESHFDYYIKGFSERAMSQFLNGEKLKSIPNFVSKDFENSNEQESPNLSFDFNLDWNPLYKKYLYHLENNSLKEFEYYDLVKYDQDSFYYRLPMIITSRAGCSCVHKGCDYCLGSKDLSTIYGTKRLVLSNKQVKESLRNIDSKFNSVSLYVLSDIERYDFSNENYSLEAMIEVDSPINNIKQLGTVMKAFKECLIVVPLSREGIMGSDNLINEKDISSYLSIQDENHRIRFLSYNSIERSKLNFLENKGLDIATSLDLFSLGYYSYNFYTDINKSFDFSRSLFYSDGRYHTNLESHPQIMFRKLIEGNLG